MKQPSPEQLFREKFPLNQHIDFNHDAQEILKLADKLWHELTGSYANRPKLKFIWKS